MGCDSVVEVDLVFEDCTNCANATPGLNLQILKNADNNFSIFYANPKLNLIQGDVNQNKTCDYMMYIVEFYNTFRASNEAYYLDEDDFIDLLTHMQTECVMKF